MQEGKFEVNKEEHHHDVRDNSLTLPTRTLWWFLERGGPYLLDDNGRTKEGKHAMSLSTGRNRLAELESCSSIG